jgi:hypothetical protein
MGIREGEFTFKLSKPLKYQFDGSSHDADHIVLKEPGMEHLKFYLRLKQMLMRAQLELAEKAGKIQDSVGEIVKPFQDQVDEIESQSEEVYQMYSVCIQGAESVDIGNFIGTFEKMVCTVARKGVCMVDGRLSMVSSIWNNLTPDDAFEMALRWCAFFGTPSIEGEKNTSEPQPESPTERTAA